MGWNERQMHDWKEHQDTHGGRDFDPCPFSDMDPERRPMIPPHGKGDFPYDCPECKAYREKEGR